MTDSAAIGLCRLTVRGPDKVIDLALPQDVPVADLLPAVLTYCGDDLEEKGLEHGGWVLQRGGGERLEPESTLETLGLHEGETLFLRPHTEALPEIHLDCLVDGITTTMRERPYSWTPESSRAVFRGFAVGALAVALTALALPGGEGWMRAGAAGAIGLLLLAGAASASRAVGDAGAGAALGFMVAPYFALAGWLLPGGSVNGLGGHEVLGARTLAASAAGAGGATLALAAVGAYAALFVATAVTATGGALGGAVITVFDVSPQESSGIVVLGAVVLGAFVPSLSFRMSGLRMPPLPTNATQLQEGIEPHAPGNVCDRSVVADSWMTSLYGATGAICAVCLVVLTQQRGVPEMVTTVVLCLLLLLHSRGLGHIWQRLSMAVPGGGGLFLLAARAGLDMDLDSRMLLVAGLAATTAAIAIASWTVPGRRLVPYWGRVAEILHSVTAIAMLPLVLWVLGVYGDLRAMNA